MQYKGYNIEPGTDTVAVYWIHEPNHLVEEFPTVAAAKAAIDKWTVAP